MNCIGVDVGKQELVTYDGVEHRTFPNDRSLDEFSRYAQRRKDLLVVYEPTSTYSRRLEAFCRTDRIVCCPLNPRVIPHLRQVSCRRSKTDETDAELLYRYGIERGEKEAGLLFHDEVVQSVSAHLAYYRVIQKARVACQGLMEALKEDPAASDELIAELEGEIAVMKEKEARHLEEAQELIAADEAGTCQLEALLTIPGIGPITAVTLIVMFRKYVNASRGQMVALAGLDPVLFQSGTSVHKKSRISKRGNREVRKRLYEATLSAARYNPSIKGIYQRLKEEGKPDKVARIAAARKLLLIAYAVYKSGKRFRLLNECQP